MQEVQISDDVAFLLNELVEREHISATDLIGELVKSHKIEIAKQDELKAFFKPYQKDMTGFTFNREEAGEKKIAYQTLINNLLREHVKMAGLTDH